MSRMNGKSQKAPKFVKELLDGLNAELEKKHLSSLLQSINSFESEGLSGPAPAGLQESDYRVVCAAKYQEACRLKLQLMEEMSFRDDIAAAIEDLDDFASQQPTAERTYAEGKPWQAKKKAKEQEQQKAKQLQLLAQLDDAINGAKAAGLVSNRDCEIKGILSCNL